jgi:hypothetical protein
VSERGLLRLTGPQRIWFLQQTITADVEDVPSGEVRESAFLTPKGKVVAHFYVGVLEDEVYLDIDPPPTDLADWLVRYRFRTKVEVEDLSGEAATLVGRSAAELVADGRIRKDGDAVLFGRSLGDVPIAVVHGRSAEGASDEEVERLRIRAGSFRSTFTIRFNSPSSVVSSRRLAIESNSSRRRTHGLPRAWSSTRRRLSPVFPRKLEMAVARSRKRSGRFSWRAHHLASMVFPVPGGPTRRSERGGLNPSVRRR